MKKGSSPSNPFENIEDPRKESVQVKEIADLTRRLLDTRYPKPDKILRGVHPKSHGCVRATFEVAADIDPDLRVGVFAEPGKRYDAWIRFSNAAVRVEHDLKDGKNGSRGMAIKLSDVDGKVFLKDNGGRSQDFLMINTPAFAFANVPDYLRLTKIILENNDDPSLFFAPLQVPMPEFSDADKQRILRSFQVVQEIQAKPVANPVEVQYFSAAPFAFGSDRVMKFSAEPLGGEKPQVLPENPSENYLREALLETMCGSEDVHFDFKIQVRRGVDGDLGIEDATTVWDEATTPFVDIARITIKTPQTDVDTPSAVELCEDFVFTPWHSVLEHQPLGSINRLRQSVYRASEKSRRSASSKSRKRANKPV